jgi:hypothetical protein
MVKFYRLGSWRKLVTRCVLMCLSVSVCVRRDHGGDDVDAISTIVRYATIRSNAVQCNATDNRIWLLIGIAETRLDFVALCTSPYAIVSISLSLALIPFCFISFSFYPILLGRSIESIHSHLIHTFYSHTSIHTYSEILSCDYGKS